MYFRENETAGLIAGIMTIFTLFFSFAILFIGKAVVPLMIIVLILCALYPLILFTNTIKKEER